jgi:hypothetical protein
MAPGLRPAATVTQAQSLASLREQALFISIVFFSDSRPGNTGWNEKR